MPWLPTKGAVQIDPTKLSALISQPLITLSLSWPAPGRAVKPSYSPPPLNPQPCPLSPFLSFSSCYRTGITEGIKQGQVLLFSKEARKKIIKKAGDLKKTRIISQIEWENLTCLITTENKHCANAQAPDWHAGCFE